MTDRETVQPNTLRSKLTLSQTGVEMLGIAAILLIAASLRLWSLGFDLPYIYHPDEPISITISQNMFKRGDLSPHFFEYPSLFFYLQALAYVPYYLVGKLAGVFQARTDLLTPVTIVMGVTRAQLPGLVLLERMITVVCGVGTVLLTFVIGKRLTAHAGVGLLAALMLAVSPSNVSNSRFITPDTFVAFFAVAAVLAALQVYRDGKTSQYVLAGLLAGCTASTKYNGGLVLVSLLAAHYLRRGERRQLYIGLMSFGLGFLATTPFALVEWRTFIRDAGYQAIHYATGHAGMEGGAFGWYMRNLWQTMAIISVLALGEMLRGVFERRKDILLLAAFPLTYFVFIVRLAVRNDRTFLPITPFLCVLAASLLAYLWAHAKTLRSSTWRNAAVGAVASLTVLCLAQPTWRTVADSTRRVVVTSRETARAWLSENLPDGTRIAMESYSPFLSSDRFAIRGIESMIEHGPEWYVENGFDYLVFSQEMYGRFYREPDKYRVEVSRYDKLFRQFTLARLFTDGGYEVRLYRVKPVAAATQSRAAFVQ